jgi:SAM-dependent methyltransferase
MQAPKTPTEYHEANRLSWNKATVAQNSHKKDQAGFLRRGGSTLFPEEIGLVGDLTGKRLVHLLCNSGQDTLSLARLGADVTGIDISDEAIHFATKLSADSQIPATFIRSDVYDWLKHAQEGGEQIDIAFCSYGATCWLSDLTLWARGVSNILKPGGRFVAIEFHPMSMMFDEKFKLKYPYFGEGKPLKWDEGVQDYVAASGDGLAPSGHQEGTTDFKNPHPVYEFLWTIGDILTALIGAGLTIEQYHEYPYANGTRIFDDMQETDGRRMRPPKGIPNVPLMYSVVATKL